MPIANRKARAVRLSNIQLLQILPQLLTQQLRHILPTTAMVQNTRLMRLSLERILAAPRRQLIDADNLLLLPVHDGDERERVGVEVGVLVLLAGVGGEDEALEEAAVFVRGVQAAVRPGLDDDFEARRQLVLGDFVLEEGRFLADFDEGAEFGAARSLSVHVQ